MTKEKELGDVLRAGGVVSETCEADPKPPQGRDSVQSKGESVTFP